MRKSIANTLAICLLPMLSSTALAGGFNEGGDAGRTVGSAQAVSGGNGSVTTISGSLSTPLLGTGDFEDVYEIYISDPSTFTITTVGSAPFDTELFLFDGNGKGLLANDDESAGTQQSTIPNAATDATGASVMQPGIYFLAITGKGNKPTSNGGQLIFNQATATEVSGPDGAGAAFIQDNWTPGSGPVGSYTIQLTGVTFLPVPPIPSSSPAGLLLLMLILAVCGGLALRKRYLQSA